MAKIYSADIRSRVVAYVEAGHSRRAAARYFGVNESFAVKLLRHVARHGSCAPGRRGRPRGSRPDAFKDVLIGLVEKQPDITMPELATHLLETHRMQADPAELSRFVCRHGFTYKRNAAGIGMRTR